MPTDSGMRKTTGLSIVRFLEAITPCLSTASVLNGRKLQRAERYATSTAKNGRMAGETQQPSGESFTSTPSSMRFELSDFRRLRTISRFKVMTEGLQKKVDFLLDTKYSCIFVSLTR